MKYSVIIPTYNRSALLREAINSVLAQGCRDLEIIVVDDGSTDDTRAMLERRFPQVRYLHQANLGPAAARNLGIAAARGELIGFLDSDDLWLPGKIERELALFRAWPDADALAGNGNSQLRGQPFRNDIFARRQVDFPNNQPRYLDWRIPIMTQGPVCNMSALVIKTAVLQRMDGSMFDPALRFDEDWDMEFRLSQQCPVLLYPQMACQRRILDDGTRHYSLPRQPKSTAEILRIIDIKTRIINRYAATWRRHEDLARRFDTALAQMNREKHQIRESKHPTQLTEGVK